MKNLNILGSLGIFILTLALQNLNNVAGSQHKTKHDDFMKIVSRKRRVSPGALVCAAIGFANNPIGGLGLCGGYQNNNLTESPIATPNQYCNSQCAGAVCKEQVYCLCPAGAFPKVRGTDPISGESVGCFAVNGTGPTVSAAVAACRVSCQNREGKTPYLCFSTVPKQFRVEYCMCADPVILSSRRKREPVDVQVQMRMRRTTELLDDLLGGLIQTVLNILQKLLKILSPLTGIVCKVLVSVDDVTARIPTCFNFPGNLTSPTCDPVNPQTPDCLCKKFCGNSDRVCCSNLGACICRDAPPGCGRAATGTAALICKGLCSAGQIPYNCMGGYCVCHDPDPLNLGLGFQTCANATG